MNSKALPKLYFILEEQYKRNPKEFSNASININISTEMLLIFYKTVKLWKKKFDEH